MFENLTSNVSKPKSTSSRKGVEIPTTIRFVRALANHNTRLSYAALAVAAEELGEHTPNAMSAGQRGSGLVKRGLPTDLQPFVCQGGGGYAKGTEWPETGRTVKEMKAMGHVRPEGILEFVSAFQSAEATDDAEAATDEEILDDEILEIDEDDDSTEE